MAESRQGARARRADPARAKAKRAPAKRASAKRAPAKRAKRPEAPRGARRGRVAVRTALFLVVLVGLLFAFVYPTRTFLDQRDETNRARTQLEVLRTENAKLAKQTKELSSDEVIGQIARERYGLVKPGETPFVILPAPTTTTAAPAPSAGSPSP